MKNRLLLIVMFLSCFSTANAGYINGHVLKSMSIAPVTDNSHLQYVGYVVGVIDSDEQKKICVNVPPNALTPVLNSVKIYLADNPNELDLPGNRLVISALTSSYGCKIEENS